MSVVVFDLPAFRLRYPEFNAVPDALLGAYFIEAGVYCNNTECSPVANTALRSILLNMLVAHLAMLYDGANGDGSSGLVGRVNTATEGSVTVGAEMGPATNSAAWYLQTQYGASYWQATAAWRTMRYVPGRSVRPVYTGNLPGRYPWRA